MTTICGARAKTMTNREAINEMTDQELAETICVMITECAYCAGKDTCGNGRGVANGLVTWLQAEAEGEG